MPTLEYQILFSKNNMVSSNRTDLTVGRASDEHRQGALRLLFGDDNSSISASLRARSNAKHELFVARHENEVVAASLAMIQPGATAYLTFPSGDSAFKQNVDDELLHEIDDFLVACRVHLVQTVVNSDDAASVAMAKRHGFSPIAELSFLVCLLSANQCQQTPFNLRFDEYRTTEKSRLQTIIERTYENSLDCPELSDLHSADDAMDLYRSSPGSSEQHWYFAREDDFDVGCLLMSSDTRHTRSDLHYFGLIPRARGHGYGNQILSFAQQICTRKSDRLFAVVDRRNHPAVSAYQRAGFFEWDCGNLFVKTYTAETG